MAEEEVQHQNDSEETTAATQENPGKKKGVLARILTVKGLAILIGLSLLLHTVGFFCYHSLGGSGDAAPCSEIALGDFRFDANPSEAGPISSAWFTLHIALLDNVDDAARKRLESRKFRVKQDVEELLRQAHSGDFDDPTLGELKRQLQEQINETLGMRAIADVIITDLEITPRSELPAPASGTAQTVPWEEKPSSPEALATDI